VRALFDSAAGQPSLTTAASGEGQTMRVHTAVPIAPALVGRDPSEQGVPGSWSPSAGK
jgi:hypothetical protein